MLLGNSHLETLPFLSPHTCLLLMQLNPEDLSREDDIPLLESVAIVTFATDMDCVTREEPWLPCSSCLLGFAESPLTDPLCIHEVLSLPGPLNSLGTLRF